MENLTETFAAVSVKIHENITTIHPLVCEIFVSHMY
jgi:hypothetical protein